MTAPDSRRVAVEALMRVEEGAYANLVLGGLLAGSGLSERDRGFVTDLVYGTTRMRRACDWLVDRHLRGPVEPLVRAVLRLGAYQLVFLRTAPHAAVSTAVDLVPRRAGGLVNAVLRRVAQDTEPDWPTDAVRLSYPDWIVETLIADLGREPALEALETMNRPPAVSVRDDGYVQDLASQWVSSLAGERDETVADLCAGPGGKATAIAHRARTVLAGDSNLNRAGLVAGNAARLGLDNVEVFVADARRPPLAPARLDRVLVDAPCSGLGVLRRRPDARWRIDPDAPGRLASLQCDLLAAAAALLRPGGLLVYSVCTLTAAETSAVDAWCEQHLPALEAQAPPSAPWSTLGRGAILLPQAADTDGMYVLVLRAPASAV